MVYQYSVFDEVKDVVKVSQVSDVDDLSPWEKKEVQGILNKLVKKYSVLSLQWLWTKNYCIKHWENGIML